MKLLHLDDYRKTSTEGFTKRVLLRSPHALVFTLNFQAGQTLPPHTHADSEIVVQVLAGEGQATVDGRVEALRVGAVMQCNGAESFSVQNTGSSVLSLLVCLCPANSRFASDVR